MKIYFNENDKMVGAIDYVIERYKHYTWFPAALKKATETMINQNNTHKNEPLKLFKTKNGLVGYRGSHYIIQEIEKYAIAHDNVVYYRNVFLLISFLLMCSLVFQKRVKW